MCYATTARDDVSKEFRRRAQSARPERRESTESLREAGQKTGDDFQKRRQLHHSYASFVVETDQEETSRF